jgi:hypothetical protein
VPLRGGDAGLSCVLLALAVVGRIMRERKSPLGAPPVVEARESGRLGAVAAGASEALAGLVPGAAAFGRVVVDGLRVIFCSSPCFAADAAVGAIRWAGSLTGRVGDFGAGFLKPPVVVLRCVRYVGYSTSKIRTWRQCCLPQAW